MLVALCGCEDECATRASVTVSRDGAELLHVCVDRAVTEDERRTGLAAYDELAAEEGLLIELPVEGEVCISAEQVGFPFDVVFIDGKGTVSGVVLEMPAFDAAIRCHDKARWVLELARGAAAPVVSGDVVEMTFAR